MDATPLVLLFDFLMFGFLLLMQEELQVQALMFVLPADLSWSFDTRRCLLYVPGVDCLQHLLLFTRFDGLILTFKGSQKSTLPDISRSCTNSLISKRCDQYQSENPETKNKTKPFIHIIHDDYYIS